jgi:hypothetical protein
MKRKLTAIFTAIFVMAIFTTVAQAKYLIYLPFDKGEQWYCVQGNNGGFSHSGKLKYAYDFTRGYYNDAFGKNIRSPVHGMIVDKRIGAPDYYYNDSSCAENNKGWGNTLLIQDISTNVYVRIAHMKAGSIPSNLGLGDIVDLGEKIGEVGNSGISSGPHLHIQIQSSPAGNAQSQKFYFVEGPIKQGKYAKSENLQRSFVLDDTYDKSLSHDVSWYKGYRSKYWNLYPGTMLNRYAGHRAFHAKYKKGSKKRWFKWRFTMARSGYYMIWVKFRGAASRDPKAEYYVYSNDPDFDDGYLYMDQQECTADNWHFMMATSLNEGRTYGIRLRSKTKNKYIFADSIKLYRIW